MSHLKEIFTLGGAALGVGAVAFAYYWTTEKIRKSVPICPVVIECKETKDTQEDHEDQEDELILNRVSQDAEPLEGPVLIMKKSHTYDDIQIMRVPSLTDFIDLDYEPTREEEEEKTDWILVEEKDVTKRE